MILVAGPPCGGKTTYVHDHLVAGDVVLDFDDIIEELAGDRYHRTPELITKARAEWRRRLPRADWVIYSAPRRSQRASFHTQYRANVLVVTADLDECLKRAEAARPDIWPGLIHQWFNDWQPSPNDRVIDTTPTAPALAMFGFANHADESCCGTCGHPHCRC